MTGKSGTLTFPVLVEGLHLTNIDTLDIVTNVLQGAIVFMSPDVKPSNDKTTLLQSSSIDIIILDCPSCLFLLLC